MKILPWIIVILVLFNFLFIDDIVKIFYKEGPIKKAPPVSCIFWDIGNIPNDYYSVGLYFSGGSNFNGHLSLDSGFASKEIFCPIDLESVNLSSGVEFLRVRCNGNSNCHVYQSDSGASVLSFNYGVDSCDFKNNCVDNEICILRMNQAENAHIAECSYSGYSTAVCCLINESSLPPTGGNGVCGDGVIDGGEQCDCGSPWDCSLEELDNRNCSYYAGYTGGAIGCYPPGYSDGCKFNLTGCVGDEDEAACGDSVIDVDLGEYCDISNANLEHCSEDPVYSSDPSLLDMVASCYEENSVCKCQWSSGNGENYSFSDCYCPEGETCDDGMGISDKYLVSEDPVTGDIEQTLVDQIECNLSQETFERRFSYSDYLLVILIIFGLLGLFFGINYYLKKRKALGT